MGADSAPKPSGTVDEIENGGPGASRPIPLTEGINTSTLERIASVTESVARTDGEILRLRGELGAALGVLKSDVRTTQDALATSLQSELARLESARNKKIDQHRKDSAAKLRKLEKEENAGRVRVGNRVKQTALRLRDAGVALAPFCPVIASDQMTEEHLVPSTEVRDLVSVGNLVFENAQKLDRDLPRVPALVPLIDQGHLIIESPSGPSDEPDPMFSALIGSLVAQIYASAPAGQMVVTVFNPRSSKVLAGYRPTGAETAGLLKVLQPTREAFEKSLDEHLSYIQRAESSIGTYSTLGELVRSTGQHEHQYHALIIIDGPSDWSQKSVELLEKLMAAGGKAGLSVILHTDRASPVFDRIGVERLYQYGSVLRREGARWSVAVKGSSGPLMRVNPLEVVADTAQAALMRMIVTGADSGSLPSIPFSDLVERSAGTTDSGVKIAMGRKGTQLIQFVLGDTVSNIQNILVGGRAGSGKTNLLKVMIYSMAARYPREELELFLLDFKEGGDFMPFVGGAGHFPLPNATVVSRDCDSDFGLATLRHFELEMTRRSNLTSDNGVSNIWDLRARTGAKVPRWVLVIDEFQGLFMGPAYQEATELLENLVRKGRSFGLHAVLATQTLSGVRFAGDKDKAIFENISGRVVLQLGPGEFTKFMQSGNDDGDQLRYRGQAIFNPMGGRKSENQMFVVARADAEATAALQDDLYREQAVGESLPGPFVYRGGETVTAADLLASNGNPREEDGNLPAWYGLQSTINPPVASAMFAPISGSHLLLLGGDEKTMPLAIATLQTAVMSAVAAAEKSVDVLVFEELIGQFRSGAQIDQWLETIATLDARVVRYDADTAQEFLRDVQEAAKNGQRTIVAVLGAENSDFALLADEGNLWRSLIRQMPRKNVNLIGHWTDLRDIPGDKNALKDDYKTMLIFGKNEQLVVDATKQSRFDLPPLHNSRTVVFAATASQEGVVSVASMQPLDGVDHAAFRALAKGPGRVVSRGGASLVEGAPVEVEVASAGSLRPVPVAAAVIMPQRKLADVLVRAEQSTMLGAVAALGSDAEGTVSLTLGGDFGIPHLLVAGGGLTGKSVLTSVLLHSLAARHPACEIQLDLLDSIAEGDFPDLAPGSLPQLNSVVVSADEHQVGGTLDRYLDEARRRQKVFSKSDVSTIEAYRSTGAAMPRWVLVWNEFPEAFSAEISARVHWLTQHGSQCGVHLVLAALTPFEGLFAPDAGFAAFAERSGRLLTRVGEDESMTLLGSTDAAHLLRRKQALFASSVGVAGRAFSFPEVSDEDLVALRNSLRGAS